MRYFILPERSSFGSFWLCGSYFPECILAACLQLRYTTLEMITEGARYQYQALAEGSYQ